MSAVYSSTKSRTTRAAARWRQRHLKEVGKRNTGAGERCVVFLRRYSYFLYIIHSRDARSNDVQTRNDDERRGCGFSDSAIGDDFACSARPPRHTPSTAAPCRHSFRDLRHYTAVLYLQSVGRSVGRENYPRTHGAAGRHPSAPGRPVPVAEAVPWLIYAAKQSLHSSIVVVFNTSTSTTTTCVCVQSRGLHAACRNSV